MKWNVSEMVFPRGGISLRRQLLQLVLLHTAWEMGSGQLHYSVLEESQHGTFVGRIAQDLGLQVSELVPRMFRVVSKGRGDYFEVNLQNGILFVNLQIDREELCAKIPVCAVHLEVIVDKPLRVFHVEVEIADINDNTPFFPAKEELLLILESRLVGSFFPLEGALDADVGINAQLNYQLSPNEHFMLDVQKSGDNSLGLIIKKSLEREDIPVHRVVLTAFDGGEPVLTGTVHLMITVLDVNDNPPVFSQSVYKIQMLENASSGTLVAKINATDLDEGVNKEISYSIRSVTPPKLNTIFKIDPNTGQIRLNGELDYEGTNSYEIRAEATDKGGYPLSGHCKILIDILDVNDNVPEMLVTFLLVPVPEDSSLGTEVALISISDRDSGANGQVNCSLRPPLLPFKLVSTFKNYFSLTLVEPLDREQITEYRMVVIARDEGTPPLSASSSVVVPISDVNDNAPIFAQPTYTIFVKENNPPGAHIFTVSASDPDVAENALVSYWLDEKLWPLSSYISVHSESGKLYALQPLDYEELKLLEFQVRAKDSGLPSLCGNVTIQVFVLDENDNTPVVSQSVEEPPALIVIPVPSGHMLGKIRALDADSGYNAWLRYELHEGNSGPWRVGLYSGEISTTRMLDEVEDGGSQNVLVVVKDHGKPPMSATATLSVSLVANSQAIKTDARLPRTAGNAKPLADTANLYLIIAICSVSSLFLLVILVYVALRCQSEEKEVMMYGPGTATLVCASEVGSWSYSNRHSRILAGVSGETCPKSDLMVFSPNTPVFAVNRDVGNAKDLVPPSPGEVSNVEP
ncbi:protocadherin alpha-5-like [Sphaerodactylus townsendi]|uniref:protocadherin alpha-5-like n=1 Tax=Sphaerodactylus townsendi TaxID=933632 RepID=UPI00202683CF|nr:protocadherin alpha-5-like [Sphaerodactylus townsendi]